MASLVRFIIPQYIKRNISNYWQSIFIIDNLHSMNTDKPNWLFPLFVIVITIVIFITDLITPLGLAAWILYIAAVLISFNTNIKKFPQVIVGFIMLFMIMG